MSPDRNRRILLTSRPTGLPGADVFKLEETEAPTPSDGEMVARTIYLSLDPYMRGRMSDGPSYATPVAIGEVMTGGTVCKVVASRLDGFEVGDIIVGAGGWQDYATFKKGEAAKVDPKAAPISTTLGVLGMPGKTAYYGLHEIGKPKAGETLVVAAASGAVGAVVGQIARIKGCRVVGVAGDDEKCAYVKDELGFDDAVNHKAPDFAAKLEAACPNGVDVYWENVGGPVFDAVLPLFNPFARMPVCGLIHWYNATELPTITDPTPKLMRSILTKRLTIRGFIVFDFDHLATEFSRDVSGWIREGKLRYREDVRQGLENAPVLLNELLQGKNFGKMIVQVSDDPTKS